jgi:dihydroflavonol-4-reductase
MILTVLGANGHIGCHLTRLLLAAGHQVRGMVRHGSDTRGLDGLPVDLVRGDLADVVALRSAMRGSEGVFHLAAPTRVGPGLDAAVVEGTRRVLDLATRLGIGRVVYTSSVVTVGYADTPDGVLNETSCVASSATAYHSAKFRAEQIALEFARMRGLTVVVVNPSAVVGGLDYRVTPSTQPIQRCLDRGLSFTFDAGVTVAHVEDVARGHWLAYECGRPGERYILGGTRLLIPEYFALICRVCGRPAPRVHLPRGAMLALGLLFSAAAIVGVRGVPFALWQARSLVGKYGWYSSAKAAAELGYSCRSAEEAVRAYVEWVRGGRRA